MTEDGDFRIDLDRLRATMGDNLDTVYQINFDAEKADVWTTILHFGLGMASITLNQIKQSVNKNFKRKNLDFTFVIDSNDVCNSEITPEKMQSNQLPDIKDFPTDEKYVKFTEA